MPLSEKARGKQRAVAEDLEGGTSVNQSNQPRLFTVRFTEGVEDLILCARPKDTVKDIREQIRIQRPQLRNRRLRLIHLGRLLTDGTLLHGWLNSLEERQQRAADKSLNSVGSSLGMLEEKNESVDEGLTWIHCSIGPEVPEGEDLDMDSVQTAQIRPARGFDRLASAGFSEEDIATIRRQFHREQPLPDNIDIESEDYDEHARALEEQWIDDLDSNNSVFENTASGDSYSKTMLQGLITGFFFPLFPFFFMRESKPPAFFGAEAPDGQQHPADAVTSVVFSKRMNMAMIMGFVINVSFGIWQSLH